jgi:plastocyanin
MKINYTKSIRGVASMLLLIVLLVIATTIHAATHMVQFGGSLGLNYSPNSMNVFVGDTIQWQGDFTMHPLSSVTIPAGASVFHQATGSAFTYIVTAAGTYNYHCDFHFNSGMTGLFVASSVTGIRNRTSSQQGNFRLQQNYPNPFNPETIISFDIPAQAFVSINVFNIIGQKVATLVNENMAAGSYSKSWDAASLPSGVYIYRLQTGTLTATKKLVLIK